MKTTRIKILKDTPFDKAGVLMFLAEFRMKYGFISSNSVSDHDLIEWIERYKDCPVTKENQNPLSLWFEVVKEEIFKPYEWVWSEKLKEALYIVDPIPIDRNWWPNMVSLAAVNENPDIYKRYATDEEIDKFKFIRIVKDNLLIGKWKSYYFQGVWKQIFGIHYNLEVYFDMKNESDKRYISIANYNLDGLEKEFPCYINGLKIGCIVFTDIELISIAKYLEIIP